MAARYVRIGQYPDYRDEIRGTLLEILASTANPGTYAAPEDVTGTFLEMGSDGLWTGASVGYLTKAQADAVLAAQSVLATLKVGVPAQVDGGPVTWRGAFGWTPSGCGPIYTSESQFPVGDDCTRIRVANPAVPKGWSWLEWTGTMWAPPAGELIAAATSPTTSPVAQVTPGNTNLTQVWASPVIPDYMIPNLLQMEIVGNFGVSNASGVSGAILGIGLSGAVPTKTGGDDYPLAMSLTPSIIYVGVSSGTHGRRHVSRRGAGFYHQNGYTGQATGIEYASAGNFVSGNNKLYAMCKASHVNDAFRLEHAEVYSRGNI